MPTTTANITASFSKYNDAWCVAVMGARGDTVDLQGKAITVTKRNGETKQVRLGNQVAFFEANGRRIYSIAPEPRPEPRTEAAATPMVPNGNYAIDDERNGTAFYRVNTPDTGRWAGFTFVDQYASDERHPVRDRTRKVAIIRAIEADPQTAMIRYGQELGRCGNCNRALTDELSRECGIGPDCRAHLGIDSTRERQIVAARRGARQAGEDENIAALAVAHDIRMAAEQPQATPEQVPLWQVMEGIAEDETLSDAEVIRKQEAARARYAR